MAELVFSQYLSEAEKRREKFPAAKIKAFFLNDKWFKFFMSQEGFAEHFALAISELGNF